nr:hypothetical protein [Tanacetum cinerariifolium]
MKSRCKLKREWLMLGLESEANTDDNTSTKQQDGSSSSRYVADAKRAWVDKVVSDKENVIVRPLIDNNTLTKVESSLLLVLGGFLRKRLLELASTQMIVRYH